MSEPFLPDLLMGEMGKMKRFNLQAYCLFVLILPVLDAMMFRSAHLLSNILPESIMILVQILLTQLWIILCSIDVATMIVAIRGIHNPQKRLLPPLIENGQLLSPAPLLQICWKTPLDICHMIFQGILFGMVAAKYGILASIIVQGLYNLVFIMYTHRALDRDEQQWAKKIKRFRQLERDAYIDRHIAYIDQNLNLVQDMIHDVSKRMMLTTHATEDLMENQTVLLKRILSKVSQAKDARILGSVGYHKWRKTGPESNDNDVNTTRSPPGETSGDSKRTGLHSDDESEEDDDDDEDDEGDEDEDDDDEDDNKRGDRKPTDHPQSKGVTSDKKSDATQWVKHLEAQQIACRNGF